MTFKQHQANAGRARWARMDKPARTQAARKAAQARWARVPGSGPAPEFEKTKTTNQNEK